MIQSDSWIRWMIEHRGLLVNAVPHQTRVNGAEMPAISFGVSSYGYDLRLCPEAGLRQFSRHWSTGDVIDPKQFDDRLLTDLPLLSRSGGSLYWQMDPYSYALGLTIEAFNMPANVIGLCVGKSTYARAGLHVNTTPVEPGWRGRLVVELSNPTPLPLIVYAAEGIAQVMFFQSDEQCTTTYADRNGKYQDQDHIVTPRL